MPDLLSDPDDQLTRIRVMHARIEDSDDQPDAELLSRLVRDLDRHLAAGGQLPHAWTFARRDLAGTTELAPPRPTVDATAYEDHLSDRVRASDALLAERSRTPARHAIAEGAPVSWTDDEQGEWAAVVLQHAGHTAEGQPLYDVRLTEVPGHPKRLAAQSQLEAWT